MKIPKIYLLVFILIFLSCKENVEKALKPDFKVVELNYNFDNYINNIRNKSEPFIIKERNIVEINVNQNGEVKIEGEIVNDTLIVKKLKEYLSPNSENEEMPTTIKKEFTYSGKILMNKYVIISASYHQELNYKKYSKIRNKIYTAYNETKNEFAIEKFGKNLNELMKSNEKNDNLKWNELTEIIPVNYTEVIEE
ncbi:hypothetical protein [Polaribacter sp. Asnod6-C07]|jgi:hypothetical protein|uniref:hypothetical protein n=1 Tax=Polaribacter sp. Asnod6-C07 TaxID=3160582 RepID=UPI0038649672